MLWVLSSNQTCIHYLWKLIVNQLPAIWVIFGGLSYPVEVLEADYPHTVRCLFLVLLMPSPTLPRHLAYADYAMPYHA